MKALSLLLVPVALLAAGCAGPGGDPPARAPAMESRCMDCGTVRWVRESIGAGPMVTEVRVDMDFGDMRTLNVRDLGSGIKAGDRVRLSPFGGVELIESAK